MNALERIGLLKMDFLGLTTLTVLHDTVHMIQQNRGVKIDIDSLVLDDAELTSSLRVEIRPPSSNSNRTACVTFSGVINRPASKILPLSTRCTVPVLSRAA